MDCSRVNLCICASVIMLILMNSRSALGKNMYDKMLQQMAEFKQLMHLQNISKRNKFNYTKQRPSTINNVSKTYNTKSQTPKPNRPSSSTSRQKNSSMQRLLKVYRNKEDKQLKNPFSKIHIRRPHSAISKSDKVSQLSKQKDKQNGRYQQIKEYYEKKYGQNQFRINSCDLGIEECMVVDVEKMGRGTTGRRMQYFRRKQ